MEKTLLITMKVNTDGAVPATLQGREMQKWLDQAFIDYKNNETPAEIEVTLTPLNDEERVDVEIWAITETPSFNAHGQANAVAKSFNNYYVVNGVKQIDTDAFTMVGLEYSLRIIFEEAKELPAKNGWPLFQTKADELQETVPPNLYPNFTMRRNAAWVALTGSDANLSFDISSLT